MWWKPQEHGREEQARQSGMDCFGSSFWKQASRTARVFPFFLFPVRFPSCIHSFLLFMLSFGPSSVTSHFLSTAVLCQIHPSF